MGAVASDAGDGGRDPPPVGRLSGGGVESAPMRLIRGEGRGPPSWPMSARDVAKYNERELKAHEQVDEALESLWELLAIYPFPSAGLVRPREAREILGLSAGQFRRLIEAGRIRTASVGGLRRIPRVEVLRLLMERWRMAPSVIKPSRRHLRKV